VKKHVQWLIREIDLWVREGMVTEVQARAILGRYKTAEQASAWGRIAFAVAGAVLIGLGVILLIAYNWDRIPKYSKLALIFLFLITAHGAALYDRRTAVRETLHVLGTMLFGAGIWLIAQIYHMNAHYPTGILVWGLGALALAWTLPSLAQALIAAVLLVLWSGFEFYGFRNPTYAAPLLVLIGLLPLAQVLKSRVLAYGGLAALLWMIFSVHSRSFGMLSLSFLCAAAALVAAALILQRNGRAPELASAAFFYGNALYFIMLFVLTFASGHGNGAPVFRDITRQLQGGAYMLVAFGLWGVALWPFHDLRQRIDDGFRVDYLAVPLVLLLYLLRAFSILEIPSFVSWTVYNLLILFSAVLMMLQGFRTVNLRGAVMGAVLLSALAFARYTDLFHSLLARAGVFLLVGAMMIGIGIFFNRARRLQKEEVR
jgi:uncharacterized membrane protein